MGDKEAVEMAISYLREYANDDDDAGLNGSGCYSNPNEVVDKWIEEIRKKQKG